MALHECPTHDSPSDGAAQRKSGLPELDVKALENSRRSHHIENRQPRLVYNVRHVDADFVPADMAQRPQGHARIERISIRKPDALHKDHKLSRDEMFISAGLWSRRIPCPTKSRRTVLSMH